MAQRLDSCVGERYGHLVVLQEIMRETKFRFKKFFICQCDCGSVKEIRSDHIRRGLLFSCGCSQFGRHKLEEGRSAFNNLYYKYRLQSIERNLDFDLDILEFKILTSSNCFYCGIEPQQTMDKPRCNGFYLYNGIDRINNNIGYIFENCVSCCFTCNNAKATFSKDQFYTWIKRLVINNPDNFMNGEN